MTCSWAMSSAQRATRSRRCGPPTARATPNNLMYLRHNPQVLEIVRQFASARKPIAALCHGAQLLAAAGVLQGRSCSAYPAPGPEVRNAGGEYVEVPMDGVHVDDNLVTGPAWPAHPAWLARFLERLGTRIEP